jgi:poly [ADP-ribose] polymerase 2/3/4
MEEIKNPVYLVMVTAGNNNKFYRMIPHGDSFTVEFGRIGNSGYQTSSYSMYQWNKKYNEKINKGYVDQTHLVADLIVKTKSQKSEYKEISDQSIAQIVERLQQMAKQAIAENYNISSNKVTKAMVDEAQIVLTQLMSSKTVEDFNKILLELFSVIPRKMSRVNDYLADNENDFSKIIQTEQDLLDVMKGQVVQQQIESEDTDELVEQNPITIIEAMGLEILDTTPEDVLKIKSNLGSCADKFYKAWRVKNIKTQTKFDKFVKDEGNIKTKLLWHGSRNENWWSIANSGLVLKPTNAVITGKMFGYGIYFATNARKSLGYTSISGSYWAKGSSNSAFMALYNVAYGKPYDVHSFDSKYYDMNYTNLQKVCNGSHCLHAHEGQMLKNDEIIVYKEEQTTIQYLVELR